jgi:hypothetical protein
VRRTIVVALLPILAGCGKIAAVAGIAGPSGSCQGSKPYVNGSTVNGTLGENECKGPGDIDGHLYAITLTAQTNFLVAMNPSGFKGALGVWTASGRKLFETNDSGVNSAKVFLGPGDYTIVAGRQNSGGGSYTLTTSPTSSQDCSPPPFQWTWRGAVISGQVTTSDCAGNQGSRFDIYEILLKAGESVTVTATMDQIGGLNVGPHASAGLEKQIAKGGSGSLTYTATADWDCVVRVGWGGVGALPNYTLSIN